MSLLARRRVMMQATRHPNDGRYCYAIGTDGYVYCSQDYGATLYRVNMIPGRSRIPGTWGRIAMADSPTASIAYNSAQGGGDLYVGSFIPKNSGSGSDYVTRKAGAAGGSVQSLCVSTGSSCYHHFAINSGTDWSTGYIATIKRFTGRAVSTTLPTITTQGTMNSWDQAANSASACSLDGKYAVIGGMAGYTNAFYTNNFGNSWAECLATQSYGNGVRDVAISGDGAYAVACTGTTWVQSNNYLATWTVGNTDSRWYSCAVSGDGRWRFLCSGHPTFYRGTIANFQDPGNIYTGTTFIRIRCNYYGTRLIAIAANGNIYYTSNGGYNWTLSQTVGDGVSTFVEIAMNRDPK